MGRETAIEWCDSTVNLMAGCDGCELWNRAAGVRHCYAGELTDRYAGRKGWPEAFEQPRLFVERLDEALRWSDLTGQPRPDKPWLDGRPRTIFACDMGDPFTPSLPLDWLAPLLPRMADSPHRWLLLTKQAKRMAAFSKEHPFPTNVWAGVSVTSQATTGRIEDLLDVEAETRFVSAEPLLGAMTLPEDVRCKSMHSCTGCDEEWDVGELGRGDRCPNCGSLCEWTHSEPWEIDWLIVGGESGTKARPCHVEWIRSLIEQSRDALMHCFVKQVGSRPFEDASDGPAVRSWGEALIHRDGSRVNIKLRDPKGGDPGEWPEDLRVREAPK